MKLLDRRSFLAALAAALAGPGRAAAGGPVYLSACLDSGGREGDSVAAFDGDGRLLYATRLPARGHGAAARPGHGEVVVFARRPGNWAAVVERTTGRVLRLITTPPDRHFFGHGTFSPDGRLLYATENRAGADDPGAGEGVLGIYDAAAAYARVDERPTHGLGPHDLALLPGGPILIANGGTRTQPGTGREILNPDAMAPSLVLLDPASGRALLKADLGPALRGLSIRHLAVAGDGEAVFACQWEGAPEDGPLLVGVLPRGGPPRLLPMPEDDLAALDNYVGSVALCGAERVIAATSPRGNTVAFFERGSGRYLGRRRMPDVCGVAPAAPAAGAAAGLFVVTSGHAGVATLGALDGQALRRLGGSDLAARAWDNHVRVLG